MRSTIHPTKKKLNKVDIADNVQNVGIKSS